MWWGRGPSGAVVPARAGPIEKWKWPTKFELRTPRYTTRLAKVPVVQARVDRAEASAQVGLPH
ncbi:DUF4113 domain-containing protein [Methylobacterium crusticola]|uniref:DUF4113 domain-containing protein n=1 Tax=Methylobacterium crusticola TaxID=1697972 RepID=UPI000FFB87B6|nr:DUF4113 domain-containing protein [Methylobacterium crusticola]